MIKLYAFILGIDAELVKSQTNASRSKIIALAQLLMIPVAIWFLSGFFMSHSLLGLSLFQSILTGVVCAFLIYLVDRSFVTSIGHSRKNLMMITRCAFAILSAVMGAIAIDTVVFGGDIAEYQRDKAKAEFKTMNDSLLLAQQIDIDTAAVKLARAENGFKKELQGKGSKQSGYGPIARKLEASRDSAYKYMVSAQNSKSNLMGSFDARQMQYVEAEMVAGSKSIIKKIHDLHEFVMSNKLNMGMYFLFFSLAVLLEIMLIIFKSGSMKTAFEEALMAEEASRMERIRAIQRNKEKYHKALQVLGEPNVLEMEGVINKYKNVS